MELGTEAPQIDNRISDREREINDLTSGRADQWIPSNEQPIPMTGPGSAEECRKKPGAENPQAATRPDPGIRP
ncbi:hypothetical protein U1Q18_024775 [Sarracenia purpurea var. burkii]